MPLVSALYSYPVKSTTSNALQTSEVGPLGLMYDRNWGIFDKRDQCLTAREFPILLDIYAKIEDQKVTLFHKDETVAQFSVTNDGKSQELSIHSNSAYGSSISRKIDQWFSNFLGVECQLMTSDPQGQRPVLTKHGGNELKDRVAFADQAPILIISEASLKDLNRRLNEPIEMNRFRPNIVISGGGPYQEDNWKRIAIQDVEYKIIQQCERCVLTTIDPITKQKHPLTEPLPTLSKYRKGPRGGVVFGVHAVPLGSGSISVDDKVRIKAYI